MAGHTFKHFNTPDPDFTKHRQKIAHTHTFQSPKRLNFHHDSDLILWETKKTLKNFPNVKEREKDILDLPYLYLQQKFNGFFPEPYSKWNFNKTQTNADENKISFSDLFL